MSSRGIPDALMTMVDDYVDKLAPQIQPRIASELELFQQKTIDSLETQIVDAFRSLFSRDNTNSSDGSRGPSALNDAAPDAYGGQSLPFADEIAKLTRSFSAISDGASDDLRAIFDLTEGRGGSDQIRSQGTDFPRGARDFLSSAINAVQGHLEHSQGSGGQNFEIGGLLGVISNTVKEASLYPDEKAQLISPEIKQRVGEKLRSQHATIAEQFTRIALDHIKRWLRGNTSTRDLGEGAKAEIEDQVMDMVKGIGGLFGGSKSSKEEYSRGLDDRNRDGQEGESSGGFSRMISDKLSTGLARVHREVRLDFRKTLGEIEKELFELLPDQLQRPLEKIFGGNPFDSQLDNDAVGQADRGFGNDIKAKLLKKIRDLVQKVQETLRESILGVVNGGHRKFERESWVFVQNMVEQKMQRYLPNVKINVPDDIGNEGVSVGAPKLSTQFGNGQQPLPSSKGPAPFQDSYGEQAHNRPVYNDPSPYQYDQGHQNEPYQQHQGFSTQQYQGQEYRPVQYQPPQQNYSQQNFHPDSYSQQNSSQHNYTGSEYYQDYQQR